MAHTIRSVFNVLVERLRRRSLISAHRDYYRLLGFEPKTRRYLSRLSTAKLMGDIENMQDAVDDADRDVQLIRRDV